MRLTGSIGRRLRRDWLTSLGVFALLALFVASCSSKDSRPRGSVDDIAALAGRSDLNVLFILVDTLRADRLGAYGYERDTSPVLDSLAASGVRFSRHLSQSSWTKCSMASLWTGLYPARTGVLRSQHAVSDEARLPAEIFREAGFRTAGIWRNGWIAPNFGFAQGFEIYHSPPPVPIPASVRREKPQLALPGSDADVIQSASEFLRAHQNERWFLYLHLMDVHQYAYDEASALFGSSYSDSYDNSIHWVDSLLGHLLDELESRGLRDRTLVVFTSDHGEAFGEHDGEGHARNVYGEVTEPPLILSFPFRLDPGVVVTKRSANVDLWPTVLSILGLPALEDTDGLSLASTIEAAGHGVREDDEVPEDRTLFAHLDRRWSRMKLEPLPQVSVIEGDWRLIYRSDRPDGAELFDEAADPSEQTDVAAEHPEIVERLIESAERYLERSDSPWGEAPTIEIDEMQIQQLRALGYGVR